MNLMYVSSVCSRKTSALPVLPILAVRPQRWTKLLKIKCYIESLEVQVLKSSMAWFIQYALSYEVVFYYFPKKLPIEWLWQTAYLNVMMVLLTNFVLG